MRRTIVMTGKDDGKKVKLTLTFDSIPYQYTRDEVEHRVQKLTDDLHEVMKRRFYSTSIKIR